MPSMIKLPKDVKSYKTKERLEAEVDKINSDRLEYIVCITDDGRFTPVFTNAVKLNVAVYCVHKNFFVIG